MIVGRTAPDLREFSLSFKDLFVVHNWVSRVRPEKAVSFVQASSKLG